MLGVLRYHQPMSPAKMNATLSLLTPDEIDDALRFVEICERGGGTPSVEADEWRRRILAWRGFLGLDSTTDTPDGRPDNSRHLMLSWRW